MPNSNYWWIRLSEEDYTNPDNYYKVEGQPSYPGEGYICAIQAPKDPLNPSIPLIDEDLIDEMIEALNIHQNSENVLLCGIA
jgi:hypothetical protein